MFTTSISNAANSGSGNQAGNIKSCLKQNKSFQTRSGKYVRFSNDIPPSYEAKIALREIQQLRKNTDALNLPIATKLYKLAYISQTAVIMGTETLSTMTNSQDKKQYIESIDLCEKFSTLSKCALKIAIYKYKGDITSNDEDKMYYSKKLESQKKNASACPWRKRYSIFD